MTHGRVRIEMDDGVELAVDVAGSGPGLLLVHGFGGAKEDFADHVPALAVDHTVVVVDHRGHGASDGPDDPAAYSPAAHSFERLVTDMFEVADALGLDRFRLLGHSMGGMVARRMVLERPDRIEALVLMDTAPGPIPAFDVDLMDAGGMVALTQGKAALKELLDLGTPLNTPAYERLLAERPGLPGVPGPEVGRAVGGDVGRARERDRAPGRRPPRAGDHHVPDARHRG